MSLEKDVKKIFKERLNYYLQEQNKTQLELSKYVGVSNTAVNNWVAGYSTPRMDKIDKICQFFHITRTDLLEDHNKLIPSPTAIKDGIASANPLRIPVVGEIAGGTPIEAIYNQIDPDDPNTWEEIPSEWTRSGKVFFALKVEGDSMEPDIPDGTIAIIEQTYAWHNNHVMAVYVNGYNATLKKVKIESNGILSLIPFNHQHETRIFTPEEIENLPVRPLGKLIETRIKW